MDTLNIGVINVSDRASKGLYEDIPGKAVCSLLEKWIRNPLLFVYQVLPDEQAVLEEALKKMAGSDHCCCLVVTAGGTGPAVRDVTPEATEAVCQKMLPGFGERMRQVSLQKVPTAILSRQTAGILQQSIIVNLPGKPRAIAECLEAVFPAIPYAIDLIGGPRIETDPEQMPVFRPTERSGSG